MNRLAGEPSAYLRQHAHQPVAWQPYDEQAFAEAQARDVPIFLSIGYAACHWCHVMARESFDDPAVAAQLNTQFVSIKVDREERPDVDAAFMAATQALSGEGGWPMSVFLTPDGQAFYAGTYLPPEPDGGRPSFAQVLTAVHEAWEERRPEVLETARSLARTLAQPLWQISVADAGTPTSAQWFRDAGVALAALEAAEDVVNGGFGGAPKFPPTPAIDFLLRLAALDDAATSARAFALAGRTLAALVQSALFDPLGGGFFRYSVTADWSAPHYEKMLHDNAGLLRVLVQWIRLSEQPPAAAAVLPDDASVQPQDLAGRRPLLPAAQARAAAVATSRWLLHELRLPSGAFASSLDADTVTDGVHTEGGLYRWTGAQLAAAATDVTHTPAAAARLAGAVAAAMGLAPAGNSATDPAAADPASAGPAAAADAARPWHPGGPLTPEQQHDWELLRPALLAQRAHRTRPARDEKVVAGWNGALLAALAEAGAILDDPACRDAAVVLGDYLARVHWDGRLTRVSHAGVAHGIAGQLEDYAGCADGFLTLFAVTGEPRWAELADALLTVVERDFLVDGVLLAHPGHDAAHAPAAAPADPFDDASASGVAVLAGALLSWAGYTGARERRALAGTLLGAVSAAVRAAPRAVGGLLAAGAAVVAGPLETAIVGVDGPARAALVRAAWAAKSPGQVIAIWDGEGPAPLPLLAGRGGDVPRAYVCRHQVCALPVTTPAELARLLRH